MQNHTFPTDYTPEPYYCVIYFQASNLQSYDPLIPKINSDQNCQIEYQKQMKQFQVKQDENLAKLKKQELQKSMEYENMNENEDIENKQKDRNMISNSIKVFKKCVKDMGRGKDSVIDRIITQKKLNYTKSNFFIDFQRAIPKRKNYFGRKFLQALLKKKTVNPSFKIIFRIIGYLYYRDNVFPAVLTSKKISSKGKFIQLQAARKIRQQFQQKK